MTLQNYVNEHSFRVYKEYLALKKHFTTDNYDYHKYNGNVRASFDSFATRKDAFFFHKLSKNQHWKEMLLSNIVKDPKIWIGDLIDDRGNEIYLNWESRIDALGHNFKNDLNLLKEDYASNFIVENGQHPFIMTQYFQNKITLETLTIICHIAKIYEYWNKEIVDKVIARDIIRLTIKYYPFLDIDQKKFSGIVRNHFFQNK